MIYEYEAEILKFVNGLNPQIKLMSYAKQQDIFNAMSQVTKFPAFFYYREVTDWSFNKVFKLSDGISTRNFVPFEQKYVGKILVKDQKDAQELASKLRFGWHRTPFIDLQWPEGTEESLRVALRLLYLKVDEDRFPDDTKGAQRYVEFSWMSQLFQEEGSSVNLVEQINIHLVPNTEGITELQIYNGDYLIKTVR